MQTSKYIHALTILILVALLTACTPTITVQDTATPAPSTATAPSPSATPTEAPTATPTPLPTASPTPAELSVRDIFERIAPSVAYVDTSLGTGSAVLVQEGYLITNAHVVWPLQSARVVFPDGTEFLDAPVLCWDLMLDMAVIGPLDTELSPAEFDISEEFDIASDVFLIGYPGEAEEFPTPTISRGLISRLRTWAMTNATYIQTDAAITGGQSGGVLVSEQGQVIGISGFSFPDSFALVLSAADVLPRAQQLITGEESLGLDARAIPTDGGTDHYGYKLENRWDIHAFVINEPLNTDVEIEAWGENNVYMGLASVLDYYPHYIDAGGQGDWETGEVTIDTEGPLFVFVGQEEEEPGYMRLVSSHSMVEIDDPDDATLISIGDTLAGSIDYPYDSDYFALHLPSDTMVEIVVESIMIDPYLTVDYPDGTRYTRLTDDDSGGGFFDTNSKLIFRAPHSGLFYLVVEDVSGYSPGGYYISVSEAPADATPAIPSVTPVPTLAPVPSPYGLMRTYHSELYPFSIQFPADWVEQQTEVFGTSAIFYDEDEGTFVIAEEDVDAAGLGRMTQDRYVEIIASVVESNFADAELEQSEPITLESGIVCHILEFKIYAGTLRGIRLTYLWDGHIGFNAAYLVMEDQYEELKPMIDYSLNTFTITE